MPKYEIMYIIRDDLDEASRQETIAKLHAVLTDNGAVIRNVSEWGSRELAYEIKDQKKGYYVVLKITAEPSATVEFDRLGKINPALLRHLITVDKD
ncbi:MAG: 30S ribosomal protein S6 [Bacilli bacterium]